MGLHDRCEATGKLCLNHDEAKRVAKRARRKEHKPASEYRCGACTWWHYGHGRFVPTKRGKRRTDR